MRNFGFLLVIYCFLAACREKHTEYYKDGALKYEVYLKNGEPDGKALKYYKDGTIMQESNWTEGVRDGTASVYYPNGILHGRTEFKLGQETGVKEEYDSLGNLHKRYHIEKSIENGLYKVYNTEGRIILEGDFLNGVQDGLWKKYYDDGKLLGKYFINKGEVAYFKEYDKAGEVVNIKLPIHVDKDAKIDSAFRISLDFSVEKDIYLGVLISSNIINGLPIDTINIIESDSLSVLYNATERQFKEKNIYGMLFEIENGEHNILGYYPFAYSIELDSVLDVAPLSRPRL